VGSLALHALVVGTLVLWSWLLWNKFNNWKPSLPITPVHLQGDGGGQPHGGGNAPGIGNVEAADQDRPSRQAAAAPAPLQLPDLPKPEARKTESRFERTIVRPQAMGAFDRLAEQAGRTFPPRDPDGRQRGPAKAGSGSPGGQEPGPGADGPRGKLLTERDKRMLRWSMRFSTQNGADYLSQLKGLGANLAIPVNDGPNPRYRIVRDLSARPARLLDEDLSTANRISWKDVKPDSVAGIMEALGLQGMRPSHIHCPHAGDARAEALRDGAEIQGPEGG
jgi:hypothetical protein